MDPREITTVRFRSYLFKSREVSIVYLATIIAGGGLLLVQFEKEQIALNLGAIIIIAPRYKYTFRLAEVAGRIRYAAGEDTGLGPAPAGAADGGGYPPP